MVYKMEFIDKSDKQNTPGWRVLFICCLLYTSDAADERSSVDLGGRRIIKKKNSIDTQGAVVMIQHTSIS